MFEAPSVMLRPNSSRIRLIVSSVVTTACGSAPTVIASGSMTMSSSGISYSPWTISTRRLQISSRSPAVWGMPVSSFDEADDRGAVLLDERQHPLEPLVLAGDGVDERLALVDGEAGLERLDDGGVDADRQVGVLLHEHDRARQEVGLVGERHAHVDVEDVRAHGHLLLDVLDDLREVAGAQRLGERLAAGRVDPLADDAERLVGPDDDLSRRRAENRVHALLSLPC